jgi:uncharacterized protein YecT (DUF1311 family)
MDDATRTGSWTWSTADLSTLVYAWSRGREGALFQRVAGVGLIVAVLVFMDAPVRAQAVKEPDPCAHAYGRDLTDCWAREVERTEDEMNRVYRILRERLPSQASKSLEKAQKLWLEFRKAHLGTQYGIESPVRTWGLDYPICLSISRVAVNRARTRELQRLLEPDDETLCPL